MYKYVIVGSGVTGLLLLLMLTSIGSVPPSQICLIDPHFDGGDLARSWTSVQSNTPWSKCYLAVQRICPTLPPSPFPMDQPTPLIEIIHFLQGLTRPLLKHSRQIQGLAAEASYDSSSRLWTITTAAGESVQSQKLLLAQGSEPRALDLPIPSIPLEIALDSTRIRQYLRPSDHVLVFGTMHSGTLVLRNALDCSGVTVTAFHKQEKPFAFARDGEYDGIKEESATIADAVLANSYGSRLSLCKLADTSQVVRNSLKATWAVYAMGFKPRTTIQIRVDGSPLYSPERYDGATGALEGAPNAWGFGIAYPNRAPDGVHWDVSVASFVDHILLQKDALLSNLN